MNGGVLKARFKPEAPSGQADVGGYHFKVGAFCFSCICLTSEAVILCLCKTHDGLIKSRKINREAGVRIGGTGSREYKSKEK